MPSPTDLIVCGGTVRITYLLSQTDYSCIYDGYTVSNNKPCIVKQYKFSIDEPALKREIELFKNNKEEFFPTLIAGPSVEKDGVFAAFSIYQGQMLNMMIENTSCLNAFEVINVLIQTYRMIKYLAGKRYAIFKLSPNIIRYDPTKPHIQFLEAIDLHDVTKETLDEKLIDSLTAVRSLIQKAIPWMVEQDCEDKWLSNEERMLNGFYRQLRDEPLKTLKNPMMKQDPKPISITEELDALANNALYAY